MTLSFKEEVNSVLTNVAKLLIDKNGDYGDSALDPIKIFSNVQPIEQIKVRIDDKLSRLSRGREKKVVQEDTVSDLIGYLVLLKIAERRELQSEKY